MAKKFKKGLSVFLAALIFISTMSVAMNVQAATIWQGNDVKLVTAQGENPYVYAIAQDPENNRWYYETSNHTVQLTGGGAVHIFPMVDTTKVTGDWTPNGIYQSGVSNYDVMYCCDAITGTDGEIYYKRVNLEDSEYFTDAQAKKLRAIVENAYPYVSVEEAKAALKEAGFAQADELDRSELITATQAAIWIIANPDSGDTYRYLKTAKTGRKLLWGGYMHEFADEITNFADSKTSTGYLINPNGVGDRVNALIDFYLAMEGIEAEAGQIVITNLNVSKSKVAKSDDFYAVEINVSLNHGADDNDDIKIYVSVNGELTDVVVPVTAATEYTVNLNAKANDTVQVVVSGTQKLERGVYFYAPKPQDIDGDGIATSREVSQNLIGVGSGETPVYAGESVTLRKIDKTANDFDGKFVDVTLEVTGNVEYENGSALPVDIIYILGGFLSEEAVMADTMIGALTDTFRELINEGVPVNFGIVPFSSTKDPVMPLTSLAAEADLEALPAKIAAAIQEAGNVYDGVNMENALLTAAEMFGASELGLMGRTDRQHLVMISSGHTYYFNSGDNNEYISTVPVSFKNGSVDTDEVFYMEKAWMRARNNSTNSYPIPKAIVEYYNANTDKYESEWDCYWSLIDAWARADIAAGDTVVYEATTREAGDFKAWMNSGKYSSNSSTFTYSGNGAVVSDLGNNKIEDVLEFDMTNSAERGVAHGVSGPNPFLDESAAHAISYERAMWEAYTFIQENITGAGINFYPVYAPLRENGTASNGSHYDYTWTTNYIGHCFMNMLAGGEAVWFSADKVFFDGIKAEIIGGSTSASGEAVVPFVEDFIGVDFDFTGEKVVLAFNGVEYTTNAIATADGATASYEFVDENGKVGFTMDYFKGETPAEERFVWYFYQSVGAEDTVTLTYELKLVNRNDTPGKCFIAYTNESATLYPNGDRNYGQIFPKPFVEYCNPDNTPPTISFNSGDASNISFMLIDKETGEVEFLYKVDIGGETSFEIPTEEGKVSAVFVKQSTSGMFWASEELDEKTQNAVIKCLKANNPSYKDHWDEFFFGEGDCTWEFKKNKSVTYTFSNVGATVESATSVVMPEVEAPVVTPEVEEPIVAPKAEIVVKGAKETARKNINGVTAIYIAANGKIPAVIWTEADTGLSDAELIAEFGAGSDTQVISGLGKYTIEYQQNKNKTKTVTYIFEVK